MSTSKPGFSRRWIGFAVAGVALAVMVGVFFFVRKESGKVPSPPGISVDEEELSMADRLVKERAGALPSDDYTDALLQAFYALNEAEALGSSRDPEQVVELMNEFESASQIGATGLKDRYLLVGDYLSVEFEKVFFALLEEAKTKGLVAVIEAKGENFQKLGRLSGNFLSNAIRMNMVDKFGNLQIRPELPRILFRRRWRMLADVPHRLGFTRTEEKLDLHFVFVHSSPLLVDKRLRAVDRISRMQPDFDAVIARALVLHEGKQSEKALLLLENAQKEGRDDFNVTEFIRYLKKTR